MDEYDIDSQKLIFHPKKVSDWLEGKQTYPIYVEISLTNLCNHNCIFCAPNFTRNGKSSLDTETVKKMIGHMWQIGVKAIMFGGEGEPLLHKDIAEIVKYAKELGLDIALTTNGVLFNKQKALQLLPYLSWIKFSVDSGEITTYAKLHGTKEEDFKTVLDNISRSKFLIKLKKFDCTVGVQTLLLKENIKTIPYLAKILKYLNADYLVLKPFSEHEKRIGDVIELPTIEEIEDAYIKSKEFETDSYTIILRGNAIKCLNRKRTYEKCYAQDFIGYIDSYGGVHSCINFMDKPEYTYGNINNDSFENIWKSKPFIEPNLDGCRMGCRLNGINIYLWELKNEKKHINFI
ncbi:MAG: radical SAM protein [Actinobacteria bacterium]|nr:radical SAM protein [Actinomycetota bacterium]MBE3114649.1 radical SAM protein [Actinomycetota bacterium]